MKILTVVVIAMLSGCASYRPIVDMAGVDGGRYESDLATCQQYASQVDLGGRSAGSAVVGAVMLGIVGGLLGNRQSVGQGAAIGGLFGAASGAEGGANAQVDVIRRCMSGRGYRVLQ